MDFVQYAVPFFILAMVLELGWGFYKRNNTYRVNDAVSSLFLGTLSQARKVVTLGVGGFVYYLVTEHFSLSLMSASSVWTWVSAMVLYDFCYYWLHRMGHERTILWAAHVAHHQSEDYNLSTALRQTSTGFLLGWLFYIPMFALGVPAEVVVSVGSLNLIYQFWVHTQHVGKLGWYEWVFVTPSNHRVHHAQNDRYLDKNYGGLFILWDRIFGTFQEELDDEPPVYGIRGPLLSFSPLKALTHIYTDMLLDSWRTKRWIDKLRVWIGRTGWRPEDVARAYPRAKTDLAHFERFDPSSTALVRWYALFQLVSVVLLSTYMDRVLTYEYGTGVMLFVVMLATTLGTALWLDGERQSVAMMYEGLRLVVLSSALYLTLASLEQGAFPQLAFGYLLINAALLFLLWRASRGSDSAIQTA